MRVGIQNEKGIARIKKLAKAITRQQPAFAFGHGYLWVIAHFAGKRDVKFLACSIDGRENHGVILDTIRADSAVKSAYINLD